MLTVDQDSQKLQLQHPVPGLLGPPTKRPRRESPSPPMQEEDSCHTGTQTVPRPEIWLEDEGMYDSITVVPSYQTPSKREVLSGSLQSRHQSGLDTHSVTSCTTSNISHVQSQSSLPTTATSSTRPGSWQEHQGPRPSVDVDVDEGAVTDDDCSEPDDDEYIDRLIDNDDADEAPIQPKGKGKGKAPSEAAFKAGPKGPNATVVPRANRPKEHLRGSKHCLALPAEINHVPWDAEESSRINAVYQDLKKVWAGMHAAYLSAKRDWLVSDASANVEEFQFNPRCFPDREWEDREFGYKFLRAMGDTGLESNEMFGSIMQGFSHKTLRALATIRERCMSTDSLSEIWAGIDLDSTRNAHYQGVYLILLHRDAAGKVRHNKHTNRKPQLVAKKMAEAKGEEHFTLCMFSDETPRVVMLLAEVLMIVFFGTFTTYSLDTHPRNALGFKLAVRLRSVLEWQYPGEHLNRSLPTNEPGHFKSREVIRSRCAYCGDSQFLQIKHGYTVREMYFVHSDGPTICSRCCCRSSGRQKGIGTTEPLFQTRPHLCPWYVRDELHLPSPACQHCGDDDPAELHYDCKVDGFACENCRTHYENRKNHPPGTERVPEHLWPLHRRRKLHCQKCNVLEGTVGADVSVRRYGTPRVEMSLCRSCAGPDPRKYQAECRGFGMTAKQAYAYRATLVATTHWPYDMYDPTQMAALPPPWKASHGWDVRDGPQN